MAALLDMSLIPLPDAVEELSFEALRTAWLTDYASRMGVALEDLNDNDPAVRALETGAYREMLIRQRVNDATRACLLAFAVGDGLDQLGADPFYNTARLELDPGDPLAIPPVPPTMESDDDYRARLVIAGAATSVAGPADAYRSIALAVPPGAADVAVSSPNPGEITVEVLYDETDSANDNLLTDIETALSADDVRPIGDEVTVVAAPHVPSQITLEVVVDEGPDLASVQAAAQARADAILQPIAARVDSAALFNEGGEELWKGAAMVEGVVAVSTDTTTGLVGSNTAYWPLAITVNAVRFDPLG